MTRADIPFALTITDLEKWEYSKADIERLLYLDPDGCFKAVVGGKGVGITTAISYDGLGWIGNVVVLPEHQGKGLGSELVTHAMNYLEKNGCETICLNSYLHKITFYENLGFKGEFENQRYVGKIMTNHLSAADTISSINIDRVIEFDGKYFGANRRKLLQRLKQEFPETFIFLQRGNKSGYLVGQVNERFCEIAPWVIDSSGLEIAKHLLHILSSKIEGISIGFTAPAPSENAKSLVQWLGLSKVMTTLRMYHGKKFHMGKLEGVIGLGGLEKG